jgi:transglutaminase-like putative cysteine protease
MRISVTHSTLYRYEAAVYPEPHTIRLRPRDDAAQRLLEFALDVSPAPAGRSESLDQDGNVVTEVWFGRMIEELSVRSSFQVETRRENPFDFVPIAPPAEYPEPLRAALAPYLHADAGPAAAEFVRSIPEAGGDTVPFLIALNRRLFESFGHTIRDDGPPNPPEVTLRDGAGSCRDLAVLFCAACRNLCIAARFVSGYESGAALDARPEMHAWAEVYLRGGGWRGYDPSQGLAVSTGHVAVAAAADPLLAAPISGAYRGAAASHIDFAISMQVDPGR